MSEVSKPKIRPIIELWKSYEGCQWAVTLLYLVVAIGNFFRVVGFYLGAQILALIPTINNPEELVWPLVWLGVSYILMEMFLRMAEVLRIRWIDPTTTRKLLSEEVELSLRVPSERVQDYKNGSLMANIEHKRGVMFFFSLVFPYFFGFLGCWHIPSCSCCIRAL